jgi:serine O-acetyltransferase
MKFHDYKFLIFSDLYRINADSRTSTLIKSVIFGNETYQYNFWMRTCAYTRGHMLLKFFLYPISKFILNHYEYKYGVSIPYDTDIGSGFYIGHFGTIVVNNFSKIGNNCNISQGVTLGMANRGSNKGYPEIGNNVAVGANCVVTKDMPDNAVVVGIPGKVISFNGSTGYVSNTV